MNIFKLLVSEDAGHQNTGILSALAEGLGAETITTKELPLTRQDVLLTFGVGERAFHPLIRRHMKTGGIWVEINYGWLGQRGNYGRLTVNGLVPPYHPNVTVDKRRWQALGLDIQPWRTPSIGDGKLLILPHTESIADFLDIPVAAWLQEATARATAAGLPAQTRHRYCHRPKEEDLANACGVYAFNSAMALEALLAGIPSLGDVRGHVLGRWCRQELGALQSVRTHNRLHLFQFLAMCQGTLEELATPGFASSIINWQRKLLAQQGGHA
jgi:hypothetical protein